jgi:hypothetical protein
MAKPRSCPYCQRTLPIGQGYRFDEQINMICEGCGKVIFPTTAAHEPPPPRNQWDQQHLQVRPQQYGPLKDPDAEIYQ